LASVENQQYAVPIGASPDRARLAIGSRIHTPNRAYTLANRSAAVRTFVLPCIGQFMFPMTAPPWGSLNPWRLPMPRSTTRKFTSDPPAWHTAFLKMLPAIRLHAKVTFRHRDAEAREELIDEVIANALQAYVRLVELGKTDIAYASALAHYGVAQVRDHRHVGGHLNIRDVMSSYCQQRKNLTVERLDKFDKVEDQWQEVLIEDRHAGPFDIVRTRLDFAAWLRSLPSKPRRIAKTLANGARTTDVAKKFNLSAGRISQFRRELAESWHRFVGDDPSLAVA
jgi:hypothetical protein